MNLHTLLATKNECYIKNNGTKWTPKGIMVHSTGANNPYLKRYVGPDDGLLGQNAYGNYWNQYRPGGQQICCHAFIGKLKDGSIATYQILPWECKGWNNGGSSNNTHIAFEICEDGRTDKTYFDKVYKEAVELCAYLCKKYNIDVSNVIDHSEGYKKGIASNHGDVAHWFPKFGKSMATFRSDVAAALKPVTTKSVDEVAQEVIAGKWKNWPEREQLLTAAGYDYAAVQKRVGELKAQAKKAIETLMGDVDGDGKISAGDARLALRAAVKLETLTDEQTKRADVDEDGKLTAADARLILRRAVGLEA